MHAAVDHKVVHSAPDLTTPESSASKAFHSLLKAGCCKQRQIIGLAQHESMNERFSHNARCRLKAVYRATLARHSRDSSLQRLACPFCLQPLSLAYEAFLQSRYKCPSSPRHGPLRASPANTGRVRSRDTLEQPRSYPPSSQQLPSFGSAWTQ